VTGQNDKKFLLQAEELQKNISAFRSVIIPNASHRVLFDQPITLAKIIEDRLK
jgi:pimeloyl-ACP methyl ester carboxylesterase